MSDNGLPDWRIETPFFIKMRNSDNEAYLIGLQLKEYNFSYVCINT